jgi:hypothetical protein
MNDVQWQVTLKVKDGPTFAPTAMTTVDAYERVDVDIAVGKEVESNIQPAELPALQMLYIERTDAKGDPKSSESLKYTLVPPGGSEEQRGWIRLDHVHVIMGDIIQLLKTAPKKVYFKSELSTPAKVTVLIGRKANTTKDPATTTTTTTTTPAPTITTTPGPTTTPPPGGTPPTKSAK